MPSVAPRSAPRAPLPAVDELLVAPESGYEILHGKVFEVPPAQEPHAERNSKLAALLEAHVSVHFNAAVDLLTRTDELTNFAPDASVYPAARDPETGGRQLEHLAFEVVSTETLGHAATKAALLVERGVRRVFALDVEGQQVLEWSSKKGAWRKLKAGSALADPCFAVPLPVDALSVAAKADDAVAAALLAKKNPVLETALRRAKTKGKIEGLQEGLREGKAQGLREGKAEGLRQGKAEGLREGEAHGLRQAVEAVCEVLGLPLDKARRQHLDTLDAKDLEKLLHTLKRKRSWPA
jgi:Uma2 family endonuclease